MKYSGAEIIIKWLEQEGIETIAGIPGGANLPLYDALFKSSIKHVLARHEQGAGFIAQGMARSTGKTAVCFATSGPGATNVLTAIADAKLDSIPIVVITGQVPTGYIGTDAFQEIDTYGMTLPITKHNFLVKSAAELLSVLPEAFLIASSGRPGPVVVDVPKDVQLESIEVEKWPVKRELPKPAPVKEEKIKEMADIINSAKKPLLFIGGGVIHSEATEQILDLARKNNLPVTTTLMGLGAFPADHPLYLGMLGMHGARYTNYILDEIDVLIGLGVRFDDRATGKASEFCPQAKIVHVDIDASEINKIKDAYFGITGDIKTVIEKLLPEIEHNSREDWLSKVSAMKTRHPFRKPEAGDIFNPVTLLEEISRLAPADAIITTDVGQHQMWTAQVYPFNHPRTFLTSGGLGTMGFGVPAAIGASLANPGRKVICISGDGSLLMNIQELATMAEEDLNVTIIILNNGHLGLVRQQQELFYNSNFMASRFRINPDFAAIGREFGVQGIHLGKVDDPAAALEKAITSSGSFILDIPIRHEENVFPMVAPGAANNQMIGGE